MYDIWVYLAKIPTNTPKEIDLAPSFSRGLRADLETGARVFADFPTENHSNWQWRHFVKNGRPIMLDSARREYRPVVQMVNNFARNHKLGLITEAKVGKGKLLICSIDLPALLEYPRLDSC